MRILSAVFVFGLAAHSLAAPSDLYTPKTFFHDAFKGFTISRVTDDNQAQPASNGYQVRFVPLFSLLAGMFPNFMTRLGQFAGVNKVAATNNRRFPVADKSQENITAPPVEHDESLESSQEESGESFEDEGEHELIQCDSLHLGLWPDRTDPGRFYKCEVDPRTTPKCLKEMVEQDTGKGLQTLERIEVPGVKPCFLLSIIKCSPGFAYKHKNRICVPDIVYGQKN